MIELSLEQVKLLLGFFGEDPETLVTVTRGESGHSGLDYMLTLWIIQMKDLCI